MIRRDHNASENETACRIHQADAVEQAVPYGDDRRMIQLKGNPGFVDLKLFWIKQLASFLQNPAQPVTGGVPHLLSVEAFTRALPLLPSTQADMSVHSLPRTTLVLVSRCQSFKCFPVHLSHRYPFCTIE